MSAWDDGYVAAALHDLKKVLLSNKPTPQFGTWTHHHVDLGDLASQLDPTQEQAFASSLGTKPPRLDLENQDQVALIGAHHQGPSGLPAGSSGDLQLAALALEFADRAHKALYFWEEGSGEILGVNWRCPWYYPFWGDTKRRTVPEAQQRFLDAAQRIRQHLDNGGRLEAGVLVKLGEGLLSDFGDSTFLPVTSLHFHHQLSAAIYLMVMKQLNELGSVPLGKDPKGRERGAVSLDLTRTVITLPPERLRYRLRDAMHLRKISQRLLIRLHQHLREQYLSRAVMGAVGDRGFTHPDRSPLVFYGKEAIVILNRRADDEEILRIAREVANETETPIKVERQPLELRDHTLTLTGGQLPFSDLMPRQMGVGRIAAMALDPETELAMPTVKPPQAAAHECAACHKPIAPGQQRTDLDDDLCETCYRIRREYRECPKCFALFPPSDRCPLCGPLDPDLAPRHPVGAGRLIRLLDDLGGERVAIIAVRIGATPEAMEIESELRLAQFREARLAGEEDVLKTCGLSGNGLQRELDTAKALMPLVHGTGGVLEYLQAVLEIGRRQEEWQEWLASQLYGGKTGEAAAHFVYRSPALTVLLVGESFLRAAYRKITEDLKSLHIAHRLDIVTCDTHYPIYDALSSLFTELGRRLKQAERTCEAKTAATEFRQAARAAYQAWRADHKVVPAPGSTVLSAHKRLHAAAQQPPGPCLTYRLLRGGQERVFKGEQARQLLEAEPSRQSSSQLHALALLAEQLGAVAPEGDEGAKETLLMDLDGRARYIAEDMRDLAAAIIRNQRPIEAAQHLRELARAIRP
jgi:hypothetical protein